MKRLLLGFMLVMLVCTGASAESLVWKAQKGNAVMYLGGTFHILRESDFPLPSEFDKAYKASQVVVFETDLGKLQDPAMQQKVMAKAMYADGSTIDKHVSAQAYGKLSEYCAANGIPLQALSRFKPSMLMATLAVMELMKLGFTQHGVDDFFYHQAIQDHKVVKGLETVDEQIDYIVSMADGDEDGFITYSINDLKTIRQDFKDLETAWREGNAEKLERLLNAELRTGQPKLYKKLIADRNRNWMPQIDAPRQQTEFILVGAAHLVGPDGIIETLRKKGYKVDKL